MTALAHQLPQTISAPRLRLLPPYEAPTQPGLSIFWRRRIVALFVLTALVVGAWSLLSLGAGLVSSKTDAPVAATTRLAGASPAGQSQTYVVKPGDTLWSIARSVKPQGDIRSALNPLMKQYSGQALQVGQVLSIPAFKD